MRTRRSLALASLALLASTALAAAQGGAGGSGGQSGGASGASGQPGGTASQPPGIVAALVNLQMEINALDTMTNAIAQQLDGASRRIDMMNRFLASKNLADDFKTFRQSWTPTSAPLSFQQAYQTAMQAEQLRGGVTPSSDDFDLLTREVGATTTMVRQQWDTLNSRRRDVQAMTQFLHDRNLLDEYHTYAGAQTKAAKQADQTLQQQQQAAAREQDQKDAAAKQAAKVHLQKQWDAQSHAAASGVNYNYSFSQGFSQASQFSQTPWTAYDAGSGQQAPTPAPDPYPGVFDYWTGTYWNGYADPYYDVNGAPDGYFRGNVPPAQMYNRMEHGNAGRAPAAAAAASRAR